MNNNSIKKLFYKDYFLVIVSALMLILSFPKAEIWWLVWIGLVPLMFAIKGKSPISAFRLGYFCGVIFFTGTLYWLFHVTKWFSFIAGFGIVMLILYLSLYFGLFAFLYSYFSRQNNIIKLFIIPSVWVATEFVRANFLTGFSWASLGLSQYRQLSLIQISDIMGIYGISFLIVMVNFAVKKIISRGERNKTVILIIVSTIIVFVFQYGSKIHVQEGAKLCNMRVGIIQPNISQDDKWNQLLIESNLEKHMSLTKQAKEDNPSLIIWPETSIPGFLDNDNRLPEDFIEFIRRINIPLLAGIVTTKGEDYYNSAILLSKNGEIKRKYNKIHLVPFGEYVPLRKWIPLLNDLVPIGDFSFGREYTVFNNDRKNRRFSVLICFEDAVPSLVRKFVNRGAEFLVNITNDAWFGDSSAPFLHLQSSVFRAVENRRDIIRSANTGVSCLISSDGRIYNFVQNSKGKKTYVKGYSLPCINPSNKRTFYTKFGDVFAYLCFGCILITILMNINIKKPGGDLYEK